MDEAIKKIKEYQKQFAYGKSDQNKEIFFVLENLIKYLQSEK